MMIFLNICVEDLLIYEKLNLEGVFVGTDTRKLMFYGLIVPNVIDNFKNIDSLMSFKVQCLFNHPIPIQPFS